MTDHALLERVQAYRMMPENRSPHAAAMGTEIVDMDKFEATIKLPFSDHLVGNPENGVVHGGVITTALDSACGLASIASLDKPSAIATLDLRIDYLKPATHGLDIYAWANCYKMTRNIIFLRGVAYHEDRDDPIANCVATFMLTPDAPQPVLPE